MRLPFQTLALIVAAAVAGAPALPAAAPSPSAAAPRDEIAIRNEIRDEAAAMVARKDFAALNATAAGYRQTDARTPSGTSKLAEFYDGVEGALGLGEREGSCEYTSGPFLQAWREADPRSPSPYIVEAEMLDDNGWCYRGSGFAGEVTEEGWTKFARQLGRAKAVLLTHRDAAAQDPAFHATLLTILNEQDRPEAEFKAELDEAVARAPNYLDIYFAAARHYLPQWGGDYRQVDEIARLAERQATAATGGYARVYWYLIGCGCFDKNEMPLDKGALRRSMAAMLAAYPDDWNVSNFAMISCKASMPLDAQRYFLRLPANYDPRWHDATWWQFCRDVAGVDKARPILAQH